jgi:hypothetical protein
MVPTRVGYALSPLVCFFGALALFVVPCQVVAEEDTPGSSVECANLVYAGNKTSRCFSDEFLASLARETNIKSEVGFSKVRLAQEEIFNYPFAIMTGEGQFSLTQQERTNLRHYLERGGFLLASAGCSDKNWDRSFRSEIQKIFPDQRLRKIRPDHPMFHTAYEIGRISAKGGGDHYLEGIEINGKIVLVYSHLGLNDTGNVKGCCCCGGNEITNAREINANILAYALTH